MKSISVFRGVKLTNGSYVLTHVRWGGGRGWFQADGIFSGSSAKFIFSATTESGDVLSDIIPDLASGINATGLYPFEAPECILTIATSIIAAGDILDVTHLTLVDVNPHG